MELTCARPRVSMGAEQAEQRERFQFISEEKFSPCSAHSSWHAAMHVSLSNWCQFRAICVTWLNIHNDFDSQMKTAFSNLSTFW